MKLLVVLTLIFSLSNVYGNDDQKELTQEFDSLGGNAILLEKAKALNPDIKVGVVQNRIVNRTKRHELYPEYSNVLGGDAYLESQAVGLNYQFHITPRWSIGLKYAYYFNKLSEEGQANVRKAKENADNEDVDAALVPDLDWTKDQVMATVNWYPLYGKFNILDQAIVHFDLYLMGGYGQNRLRRKSADAISLGAGLGLWLTKNLTARLEVRYEKYEVQRQKGIADDYEMQIGSLSLGYML